MAKVLIALLLMSSAAFAGPKLYVFDCGLIAVDDVTMFGLEPNETAVRELFVPCYLIKHDKGTLLWNTGLPLSVAGKGHVTLDVGSLVYDHSIVEQLASMHIEPRDLTYVAFSHLHSDHAGGANAFVETNVLMQKTEWNSALAGNPEFEPVLFEKLKGADAKLTIIDGDYDVFGDDTVRIVYAPGHTPGHQALLVKLDKTGPILLSGDVYHFRESRSASARAEVQLRRGDVAAVDGQDRSGVERHRRYVVD